MELLSAKQCFDVIDGNLHFIYTAVVVRQDGVLLRGKSPLRKVGQDVCVETLEDVAVIPADSIYPALPVGCTVAPGPDGFYVKEPQPLSAGLKETPASLVIQELIVCEIIRRNPHPNIVIYHGCLTSNGQVTGLCFTKYPEILAHKLNPGYLNKATFIHSADITKAREAAAKKYLPGIKRGIQHLHSIGLIHNDLNPANIAISDNDEAVIIDFDSCTIPGAALDSIKRTYGWFDRSSNIALESNDLDALEEIEVWLVGSSPEAFRFEV